MLCFNWDYSFIYNYWLHLESLKGATFNLLAAIKSLKFLVLSSGVSIPLKRQFHLYSLLLMGNTIFQFGGHFDQMG